MLLDDDDDLVHAGFERFLDDQQNSWLGDSVVIHNWEQLLLGCLGCRKEPSAEPGCRNQRLAHLWPGVQCQCETRHFQVTLNYFNHRLLIGLTARNKLRCAIAL